VGERNVAASEASVSAVCFVLLGIEVTAWAYQTGALPRPQPTVPAFTCEHGTLQSLLLRSWLGNTKGTWFQNPPRQNNVTLGNKWAILTSKHPVSQPSQEWFLAGLSRPKVSRPIRESTFRIGSCTHKHTFQLQVTNTPQVKLERELMHSVKQLEEMHCGRWEVLWGKCVDFNVYTSTHTTSILQWIVLVNYFYIHSDLSPSKKKNLICI
jgi:hypothetical protein